MMGILEPTLPPFLRPNHQSPEWRMVELGGSIWATLSLSLSLSLSRSFALYLSRPQVTVLNTVVSRGCESPLHLFHKWVLLASMIYQRPSFSTANTNWKMVSFSQSVEKICLHQSHQLLASFESVFVLGCLCIKEHCKTILLWYTARM